MTKDFKLFIAGLFTILWMLAFFLIGICIYPAFTALISLFMQRPLHEVLDDPNIMNLFWLCPIGLTGFALILGIRGALPGTRSKKDLTQLSSSGVMSTSNFNLFRWASWASLVVPLIANLLCRESSHFWFSPEPFHSAVVMRHYGFMVSTIIGFFVFFGDVGFKQWRLF
jgi:hypothetical protein